MSNEPFTHWSAVTTASFPLQDDCPISKYDNSSFPASVALAAASDYVVLMLGIDGTVEGESMDRTSIDLPQIQHDLAGAYC